MRGKDIIFDFYFVFYCIFACNFYCFCRLQNMRKYMKCNKIGKILKVTVYQSLYLIWFFVCAKTVNKNFSDGNAQKSIKIYKFYNFWSKINFWNINNFVRNGILNWRKGNWIYFAFNFQLKLCHLVWLTHTHTNPFPFYFK